MTEAPVTHRRTLDAGRDPEQRPGRDAFRTPMQWNGGPQAGFTTPKAHPWLPVARDASRNVAAQAADPRSVLNMTRDLIALRNRHHALVAGAQRLLPSLEGTVAWQRGQHITIWLNLAETERSIDVPASGIMLETTRERDGERVCGSVELPGHCGLMLGRETAASSERRAPTGTRCLQASSALR